MIDTLLVAGALVLIVEGIGPMLFPNRWRAYMLSLAAQPGNQLRTLGGCMVTIGIVSLLFLL